MLSKKPEKKYNYNKKCFYTNSARQAWGMILQSLPNNSKILLPSYIGVTDREGSGIYDPVTAFEIKHDFYELKSDLSIDIEYLKSKLNQGEYNLILIVHYFGFQVDNIIEIAKICKEYDVVLVEDCAHLFTLNLNYLSNAGNYGDMSFYSLHKNFPLDKGGLLLVNNKSIRLDVQSFSELNNKEEFLFYDILGIAEKRIENYKYLQKLIENIDGIVSFKNLKKGDIPHNYPILVSNNLREPLYFWLLERGVHLIALYYRLIPPLNVSENNEMIKLSNNILNLPIHQDVDKKELVFMVELIKQGIKELN